MITTAPPAPRIIPFGDAALLIEWGTEPDLELNAQVHALAASLEAAGLVGIRAAVPGFVSLLLEFDPLQVVAGKHTQTKHGLLSGTAARQGARARRIPVVYGGDFGPDLDAVASELRLTPARVVELHTSVPQTVYMLGFSPGFPYLGDLPAEMSLPRRRTPRERVEPGSVAIAGRQTGIYTTPSPGGWHLLGRTPRLLFDPHREPPAYLAAGDQVELVPISADEWGRYAGPAPDW